MSAWMTKVLNFDDKFVKNPKSFLAELKYLVWRSGSDVLGKNLSDGYWGSVWGEN